MKKLITLLILCVATEANAAPNFLRRLFQDIKLPSQQVLEKDLFSNPLAQNTVAILSLSAGPADATATTVSTFLAQPDFPRNLILSPSGTFTAVAQCTVQVNGTNARGQSISEDFKFSNNATAGVTGNFAFKTVTSVVFPANCEDGSFNASWNLGYGVKFGLKGCLTEPGDVAWTTTLGAFDATRSTVSTGGTTSVHANTVQFATSPNAGTRYSVYYVQNFRCP